MNASPITTWEKAEAYFTFADNPAALTLLLVLAIAVMVGTVIATVKHENSTYIDYQ